MKKIHLFAFLYLLNFSSAWAQNLFSENKNLQTIYSHIYNRQAESLLPFFQSNDYEERKMAYLGFGSVQDSMFIRYLFDELDKIQEDSLSKYLVYSIGQTKCKESFYLMLDRIERLQNRDAFLFALESIGKTSQWDVSQLFVEILNSEKNVDHHFIRFWVRGLYQAKRNKNLNYTQEYPKLQKVCAKLLKQNKGVEEETKELVQKIFADKPKPIVTNKTLVDNTKALEDSLAFYNSPYAQVQYLQKTKLSSGVCLFILSSNMSSLVKYNALEQYFTHHATLFVDDSILHIALQSKDIALISRTCEFIQDRIANKKSVSFVGVDKLTEIQNSLSLPQDLETWIDLQKTILSIQGKSYQYSSYFNTGYTNPIDWAFAEKIPSNQKVRISTTKGDIEIVLLVEETPASVTNFLKLVDSGYYNKKFFHRVVPNFVIQGGCPRGDGWGSLNWIQKSEFSSVRSYKPGSVGLASAGKDSEGVQFFITHTYTTNLDGKYTQLGEVVKGMEIVNQIHIGDQILSISRITE